MSSGSNLGSGSIASAECRSTLLEQLGSLKAQMAAVEAQGEALRFATKTVEDGYRKMAVENAGGWRENAGAGLWPMRGLGASAGGG